MSSANKNKVDGRLRSSASTHFNVMGPDLQSADEANGLTNIVSSKSSAVLPIASNRGPSKQSKYVSDQAKAVKEAERFRVKNSIQN